MNEPLLGTVNLPGSKSESNRALMIAAYGGFPLEAENLSEAHDTVLLKTLLKPMSSTIDCEDAGSVARFLLAYFAGKPGNWLVTGTERLCQRPMAPLIDALRRLGADLTSETLPVGIMGQALKGGAVTLDASQSSQFASSLLMAAPTWEQGLRLTLKGSMVSMPYLEMTLFIMEHFGVHAIREGHVITVARQPYRQRPFTVSADWSAASYWYEMLALNEGGGELLLKGLKADSLQGDSIVAEWYKPFGITTVFEPAGARLVKAKSVSDVQHLVFDFTSHPDLFPAVYATCAALGVDAVFKGTSTLSGKESNRLETLRTELARAPQHVGLAPLPVFHAHDDHRVAMALASLWPLLGPVTVDNPLTVNKSYPGFWKELSGIQVQ